MKQLHSYIQIAISPSQSNLHTNMSSPGPQTLNLKRKSAPPSLLSQPPLKKPLRSRDLVLTSAKPRRSRNIQDLLAFHEQVVRAEALDLEKEADCLAADSPAAYLDSVLPLVERRLSRYSALLVLLNRLQASPV